MNLDDKSLDEVERLMRDGWISEAEATDYVRRWNGGPHLTQAVISGGRIRNFDVERGGVYRHLFERFGVRS